MTSSTIGSFKSEDFLSFFYNYFCTNIFTVASYTGDKILKSWQPLFFNKAEFIRIESFYLNKFQMCA